MSLFPTVHSFRLSENNARLTFSCNLYVKEKWLVGGKFVSVKCGFQRMEGVLLSWMLNWNTGYGPAASTAGAFFLPRGILLSSCLQHQLLLCGRTSPLCVLPFSRWGSDDFWNTGLMESGSSRVSCLECKLNKRGLFCSSKKLGQWS